MPYNNIKAVIFDLDNTLADRKRAFYHHARYCADRYLKDKSLTDKFIQRLVFLDNNGSCDKALVYDAIYSEFPLEGTPSEMSARWNVSAAEYTIPEPYADETLRCLKDKYTLALLTNGSARTQNIKLDKTGLRHYFSAVVISEETGTMKPDPAIFHLICDRINTPAKNCIYIGDNFENDVKGARLAGMSAVFYDRYKLSGENYTPTIICLNELTKILG